MFVACTSCFFLLKHISSFLHASPMLWIVDEAGVLIWERHLVPSVGLRSLEPSVGLRTSDPNHVPQWLRCLRKLHSHFAFYIYMHNYLQIISLRCQYLTWVFDSHGTFYVPGMIDMPGIGETSRRIEKEVAET